MVKKTAAPACGHMRSCIIGAMETTPVIFRIIGAMETTPVIFLLRKTIDIKYIINNFIISGF